MWIQALFAILGSGIEGVKEGVVAALIWWRAIFLCMLENPYA